MKAQAIFIVRLTEETPQIIDCIAEVDLKMQLVRYINERWAHRGIEVSVVDVSAVLGPVES